jgi:hypothetical protein
MQETAQGAKEHADKPDKNNIYYLIGIAVILYFVFKKSK